MPERNGPGPDPEPGMKMDQVKGEAGYAPKLSLCMIVRDEEDSLGLCLEDIRGLTDEVVVIDTGSMDRTREIAGSFGARVSDFPWRDDFSAARNESIKRATGDYILWLDADDRLPPESREGLIRLKSGLSRSGPRAFRLPILNRKLNGESALSYQLRIFPNIEGARFEGRVHERIEPSLRGLGIPIERSDVRIIHTGYEDDEAIKKKASRNLAILLGKNGEGKRTPEEDFHLAQSYFGIRDYSRCIECLDRVLSGGRDTEYYKYAIPMAADCHLQLGQGDLAVEKMHRALGEFPESGYLHYVMGSVLTLLERYKEAIPFLTGAASLGIEVESFPVPADIPARINTCLGLAMEGTGRRDLAEASYRRALREFPDHVEALRSLGFLMSRLGRIEEALGLLEKARRSSAVPERGIWLALARIYRFLRMDKEAIHLYEEILGEDPGDRDALAGMAGAGMTLGRADCIIFSFDGLLKALGMNANVEVTSFDDLARLAREISRGLKLQGDEPNAAVFHEIALELEPCMIPPSGLLH